MADQVTEKKPLLIFAHTGEAQSFLENSTFKKVEFSLAKVYQSRKEILLISGEGYLEILPRLTAFIESRLSRLSALINLGVAGALNRRLALDQLVAIKAVRLEADLHCQPLHTQTPGAEYTCVTAMQRVLDEHSARRLARFADVVDREAWAVCKTACLFNLPVYCFKLISDFAGALTRQVNFREESRRWSTALWEHYQQNRHILSQS